MGKQSKGGQGGEQWEHGALGERLARHTVIVDQSFYISHDLGVSPVGGLSHGLEGLDLISPFVCGCRLRVQNERDRQQALREGPISDCGQAGNEVVGVLVWTGSPALPRLLYLEVDENAKAQLTLIHSIW